MLSSLSGLLLTLFLGAPLVVGGTGGTGGAGRSSVSPADPSRVPVPSANALPNMLANFPA